MGYNEELEKLKAKHKAEMEALQAKADKDNQKKIDAFVKVFFTDDIKKIFDDYTIADFKTAGKAMSKNLQSNLICAKSERTAPKESDAESEQTAPTENAAESYEFGSVDSITESAI